MKKRIYLFLLLVLIFILSPIFIRYLLIKKKIKVLNSFYFNFPGIINSKTICPNYISLLEKSLDRTYSVSIINEKGKIIASYNDDQPRVPASNQKLFSSAYVLSQYKLNNNLKTKLLKSNNNDYYLVGQGDPDLSYLDIYKLLSNIKKSKNINFYIVEIDSKFYWPEGWTSSDKKYEFGAPITTLAIESNNNKNDNIYTLNIAIEDYIKNKFPNSNIRTNNIDSKKLFYINKYKEIDKVISNPIISLLTLMNSESHNFTAESLFKNASNTWNENKYDKLGKWLRNKGLPLENTHFADASGLSRSNKVTSNLIALFLDKMKYSKDFKTYQSTLSILGVRGTLANQLTDSELTGKFFGKTGTLSNVFALSGYLYKDNKSLIISIIQNSEVIDKEKAFNLLSDIYHLKSCD